MTTPALTILAIIIALAVILIVLVMVLLWLWIERTDKREAQQTDADSYLVQSAWKATQAEYPRETEPRGM
jgi:hypothetical protein